MSEALEGAPLMQIQVNDIVTVLYKELHPNGDIKDVWRIGGAQVLAVNPKDMYPYEVKLVFKERSLVTLFQEDEVKFYDRIVPKESGPIIVSIKEEEYMDWPEEWRP